MRLWECVTASHWRFFIIMEHKIFRHNNGESYTILSNLLLQDVNITFFSKGLLLYLLSLPKTWEISVAQIAFNFGEKESRILRAFRELIELGYCIRKPYYADGRLRGQHYYVSDVAGDFVMLSNNRKENNEQSLFDNTECEDLQSTDITDNSKSQCTQKNRQQVLQTTEKTDPKESGGSNKINNNQEKINNFYNKRKKTLFSENSTLTENFILERFSEKAYEQIDVLYYYHAVKDWSESSNTKRTESGWLSTIRNFMRSDKERGTLHLKPQYQQQSTNYSQMTDYLNL